jgi:DNA-binding HxlR family transcriptional regulator
MGTCDVFEATGLLGKKWTLIILEQVALHKNNGFNFLFRRIRDISPKILSSRLKDLEKAGFLDKEIEINPLRSKYNLSRKGKEIYGIFKSMKLWNSKYGEDCHKRECVGCELINLV